MIQLTRRGLMVGAGSLVSCAYAGRGRASPPHRLATIGAGEVGRTLGQLWIKAGFKVMFSAWTLEEAQNVAREIGVDALAGTPEQAALFGDVILLAVPYGALPGLGRKLDSVLKGKIVLDATNPYVWRDGDTAVAAQKNGAGIMTQSYFPHARVVRGLNSINMSSIRTQAHRAPPLLAVPIAGDDPAAVAVVEELVRAAGLDPVVTGNLASATLFQPGHDGFEVEASARELKADLKLSP